MRREEKCKIFNYIINSMILFWKCKISARIVLVDGQLLSWDHAR